MCAPLHANLLSRAVIHASTQHMYMRVPVHRPHDPHFVWYFRITPERMTSSFLFVFSYENYVFLGFPAFHRKSALWHDPTPRHSMDFLEKAGKPWKTHSFLKKT